ncbi:MAG: alpha/beta fold hydrolase, partial [Chthoniobacteraceae bacterium]
MKLRSAAPFLVLGTALVFASCAQYSSVSERRPPYRYQPLTPVGALIVKALSAPRDKPEQALGDCLDAAAAAERALRVNPGDATALRDYNYAVSRLVETMHDGKLQPWVKPVVVTGADGPWQFSIPAERQPERNPDNYLLFPADRYQFKGTYVAQRSVKAGLGAPVVVTSKPEVEGTKIDRFAQGKHIYYGITVVLRFEGRRCVATFEDPLSVETVKFAGHTFPLAADFTAPIALALARENPKKLELARLLRPQEYAETARLARLQPYDPAKIPVVCVHGLMDTQATWTPIITSLRADPEIRKRYQFWFYSYPSGYPYMHSAAIMRRQLDEIGARYPGHKKIVLIGHSMGGCISRLMITDTGDQIWRELFGKAPAQTQLSPESRKL